MRPLQQVFIAFIHDELLLTLKLFSLASPGAPKSSCTEGTVLEGLNWLKDQPPVLAQADDAYPDWLWRLLDPKVIPDDGPGGKGEKIKLRIQNRRRIRDQNFMKTQ